MKPCTYVSQIPAENTESQFPNQFEDQSPNSNIPSFRKKTIPWHLLIIAMLVIMLISTSLLASQYKEYGEVLAKEAYVISVSIDLMEDTLMFKYGILPEDIGFDKLRSAWIENPCHETSKAYYNALKQALDSFEQEQSPTPEFTPLKV